MKKKKKNSSLEKIPCNTHKNWKLYLSPPSRRKSGPQSLSKIRKIEK